MAKVLLDEDLIDRDFVRRWVNWRTYLEHRAPGAEPGFERFLGELRAEYARYTPEYAEAETGVPAHTVVQVAREIAAAAPAFSSHIWRAAAAGNLHGWQVTRALWLLNVLTGSVGTVGGVSANAWNKFIPAPWKAPSANRQWNELNWPREYPLAHNEMSILYPHFLLDGDRGDQSVLFSRVLNPVWTYPDGYAWMRALRDESCVGLHGAMTPTWSETAWWADYVLPMGHGPERHDTHSYETHAGRWLGFRQPVRRVAMEKLGRPVEFTYEANPGEVWEEGEFWIEVSWRADPDGSLGIRQYYESPYRPGEKIRLEEYYRWMFENSVPGLPEKAAAEDLTPLQYMRRYGAVEISRGDYAAHEAPVEDLEDTEVRGAEETVTKREFDPGHLPLTGRPDTVAAQVDGVPRRGFNTPSRKLELFQPELAEWGWPEHATPAYFRSHIHHSLIDHERGEYVLLPTYRLPTLIHSRSGNAKFLNEISHTHPLLLCPEDAERIGVGDGDLARVETEIGWFVIKALVTEGIRPGVVAASHHMGRWRLKEDRGNERWSSAAGRHGRVRGLRDLPPDPRRRAVGVRRPQLEPRVVERRGRPPEHHLPGAPGPDQRDALLASEGPRARGRARRPLRGHPRRLREVACRLPQVARARPARGGRAAPADLALPAGEARARRLRPPGGRAHARRPRAAAAGGSPRGGPARRARRLGPRGRLGRRGARARRCEWPRGVRSPRGPRGG